MFQQESGGGIGVIKEWNQGVVGGIGFKKQTSLILKLKFRFIDDNFEYLNFPCFVTVVGGPLGWDFDGKL